MSTYFTADSIINLIPAQGTVTFTDKTGESWTLPLIGWGVVIRHSAAEEHHHRYRSGNLSVDPPESDQMWAQHTELQPVILDNLTEPHYPQPMTVAAYREEAEIISHTINLANTTPAEAAR